MAFTNTMTIDVGSSVSVLLFIDGKLKHEPLTCPRSCSSLFWACVILRSFLHCLLKWQNHSILLQLLSPVVKTGCCPSNLKREFYFSLHKGPGAELTVVTVLLVQPASHSRSGNWEDWLGTLPVHLVAELGAELKRNLTWKEVIKCTHTHTCGWEGLWNLTVRASAVCLPSWDSMGNIWLCVSK